MLLPFSPSDPTTQALKADPSRWRDAARALCDRHAITMTELTPYPDGAALVAAVSDDAVIKIIQPPYRDEWERERWAQGLLLRATLPIEIPRLLASGESPDGWTYLISSRVHGTLLKDVWPSMDAPRRAELLSEIGRAMAAVHAVRLVSQRLARRTWDTLVAAQLAGCRARHARLAMPQWLLDGCETYARAAVAEMPSGTDLVLLTGEYTLFNLLVEERGGRWALTGMVDFGDAMEGPREYDWIGPGVFLCAGDPELLHAFLRGYRGAEGALDDADRRTLMALHLIHRFSDLDRQIALRGWRERAESLDQLAALLWPR